jgi:hypothetical protein
MPQSELIDPSVSELEGTRLPRPLLLIASLAVLDLAAVLLSLHLA